MLLGGLSRERIRQLEERALKKLQSMFIEQCYAGKNYHVHPAIHRMIQIIRDIIEAEPSKLILETKLLGHVSQTLNVDTYKVSPSLFLILPLMSIERIEFDYPNSIPAWGYIESTHRSILEKGIKRLDELLTQDTPLPYIEFDILVLLNKKAKKSEKVTSTQLSWLIDLCISVGRREDGSIWGKFEHLKGRGNQMERLLVELGVPMNVAELAREINHRLVPLGQRRIVERNLTNQLIGDERFVAIGRSGKWGLKSWTHIDTKSVLELMEQYLIIQNKPATIDELYAYVSERRPVSKNSIITYLTAEREHFAKVGLTTWGLAKWSNSTNLDIWNRERIADFVANIFKENKTKELDYKIIKEALMKEATMNPNQADGFLRSCPAIKTRVGRKWNERISVLQSNYKNQLKSHERRGLRQQVEESVHEILSSTPNKQMPMADLVRQLQKQIGLSEVTLYMYVGKMNSIERINLPDSRRKLCRAKETTDIAGSGTLRERVNKSVRVILEAEPNNQIMMADLLKRLQKEYGCPKATLYQYIAGLDYLERLELPNSNAKLCRMKDIPKTDVFPQIQHIVNPALREEVTRALPDLTEERVDIGLFLLGRTFETTLKTFLVTAYAKGKLKSTPGNKSPNQLKLVEMVSCLKSNDIVTDDAVLSYLRQTRNDRAHGGTPSLTERHLLMKNVQHLAGLYFDYIKWLDDLTRNL